MCERTLLANASKCVVSDPRSPGSFCIAQSTQTTSTMSDILDSEPMLSTSLVCTKCRTSFDTVQTLGPGFQVSKHNRGYCCTHISVMRQVYLPFFVSNEEGDGLIRGLLPAQPQSNLSPQRGSSDDDQPLLPEID